MNMSVEDQRLDELNDIIERLAKSVSFDNRFPDFKNEIDTEGESHE